CSLGHRFYSLANLPRRRRFAQDKPPHPAPAPAALYEISKAAPSLDRSAEVRPDATASKPLPAAFSCGQREVLQLRHPARLRLSFRRLGWAIRTLSKRRRRWFAAHSMAIYQATVLAMRVRGCFPRAHAGSPA